MMNSRDYMFEERTALQVACNRAADAIREGGVRLQEADERIGRLTAERNHWLGLVSRADVAQFPFEYKPSKQGVGTPPTD